MATATLTSQQGDQLPTPPPAAEINPQAAAQLADLRTPLVANHRSLHWITENICSISEGKTPFWWWAAFIPCAILASICFGCFGYLIFTGVGVWGENVPAAWAWDITNFVFWIGIGHAGTLISAILFLTRQKWRTAVNRAAEAMTLFAVICAGLYPGLHVGRVWMAWFLAPVPNLYAIWPNFRSPLLWDVFAVSTYFTVSVLFWFTGLIPDLATLRDRARARGDKLSAYAYGFFALGWRGGNRQWRHYEMAYLLLAALSTPLVLSVHTIVSFDFATSVVPGWHTTIFPPYFVAGAIFGGFAMVLTLMLPMRLIYPQLKDMITPRHIDVMSKIILLTGSIVGYAYIMEFFVAWYSGNMYEGYAFLRSRAAGPVTDALHYLFPHAVPSLPWAPYWWAYYCDDELQRPHAAGLLVPVQPAQPVGGVHRLYVRQRGHVVRAVRHYRDLHCPRLPAVELGHVPPDLGGHHDLRRHVRPVPIAVPAVHPLPAGHRHRGGQGRHALSPIRTRATGLPPVTPAVRRPSRRTSSRSEQQGRSGARSATEGSQPARHQQPRQRNPSNPPRRKGRAK